MESLSVKTARTGDRQTLIVTGELAMAGVTELTAPAMDALADRGVRSVVVDLAGVTFIDSTGIGALVSLHGTAGDVGAQLILRNPTARILEVLRIIHMDRTFLIDPPPPAAEGGTDQPGG